MISGGVAPGGSCLSKVCEIAVTCALAVAILTEGWKKILTMPNVVYEFASICSISLTVVVSARSNGADDASSHLIGRHAPGTARQRR